LKVLPQLLVPLLLWNTSWSYWTLASRAGRPDVESKTFVKRIFKKDFKQYVKQEKQKNQTLFVERFRTVSTSPIVFNSTRSVRTRMIARKEDGDLRWTGSSRCRGSGFPETQHL